MPFDPGVQDPALPPTEEETKSSQCPIFHPSNLVCCTFLIDPQEDGQRFCTCIVQAIEEQDAKLHSNTKWLKFHCSINDDQYEEILSYYKILNYIEQQDGNGTKLWKFKHIIAHDGSLKPTDPTYKGSKYNVMIKWENGKVTSEPLTIITADDLVTCTIYARENDLLNQEGWGSTLKPLPGETRKSYAWPTKQNSSPIAQLHNTSMVMKSHKIATMPSNLTSIMAIPSGKTPLPLR